MGDTMLEEAARSLASRKQQITIRHRQQNPLPDHIQINLPTITLTNDNNAGTGRWLGGLNLCDDGLGQLLLISIGFILDALEKLFCSFLGLGSI